MALGPERQGGQRSGAHAPGLYLRLCYRAALVGCLSAPNSDPLDTLWVSLALECGRLAAVFGRSRLIATSPQQQALVLCQSGYVFVLALVLRSVW